MSRSASLILGLLVVAGCSRPQPPVAPTKPTEVVVESPIVRDVTEFEDFTGRTEAFESVEIRARVTGYLNAIHFVDGADVAKGALLFEIDPKLYQAEYDKTQAAIVQAQAHLDRVQKDYDRAVRLHKTGSITDLELDRYAGDKAEADATVGVAVAARKLAKENLDYTRIYAPFAGRISRRYVDSGNLIKADDTVLTTVVAIEKVHAYFDIDDRTLLKIRKLIREGKVSSAREKDTFVKVGLPDEDGFSLAGLVNFIDNKVDPGTGTLRVRALVENPAKNKNRLLSPGMFVRIRLPIGDPHSAVLVPEVAVGTDQGQKFLYLVNEKDEVVYRPVKLGAVQERFRVVESGVAPTDRVIVSGLQRVRPGVKVAPKTFDGKGPEVKPADPKPADPAITPSVPAPRPTGG